ncbi:unnamed protein product [Ixodes pacificus]
MLTGVSPFICSDCISIERTHSPSSDEARPDDEQDSPCPGRLGVDSATSVALLRDLLADALNGISFLTDQMTAVREENARLRSELTRSSEISGCCATVGHVAQHPDGATGPPASPEVRRGTLAFPRCRGGPP